MPGLAPYKPKYVKDILLKIKAFYEKDQNYILLCQKEINSIVKQISQIKQICGNDFTKWPK